MNLLTLLSLVMRLSTVPWVDLAQQEYRAAEVAHRVGSERLAITARFTRAKAFALAGVDTRAGDTPAYESRLAELRRSGQTETADIVTELQRQADAEERWAQYLAEQNASVRLTPGDTEPPPPTLPRPTPPPRPTSLSQATPQGTNPYQAQPTPPQLQVPGAQPTPPGLSGSPAQPTPGGQPAQSTPPSLTGSPAKQTPSPKPAQPTPPPSGNAATPTPSTGGPAEPSRSNDPNFLLTIPKLGLTNVPIVETDVFDETRFLSDLHHGVAHDFCHPGEPCKSVIFGHSSGYTSDTSPYKRVFARLNEMEVGDRFTVNYRSRLYTYVVFKKEIVDPTAIQILRNYNWEELTLFTCWPINTWQKRLVLYTKRV